MSSTARIRLAALALAAIAGLSACVGIGAPTLAPASGGSPGGSPASIVPSNPLADCPTAQAAKLDPGQTRTVTIVTSKGTIVIKVEGSLGPNAAGNFIALASCGYYDHVVFHRLAPGFVIQGGDGMFGRSPNVQTQLVGRGNPGYQFPDDPVTVPYTRATVAMANSGPDTNGSQFFICLADLSGKLGPNYSVFGHVTSGMEAVDAIAAMPITGGATDGIAEQPVAMDTVTVANP
jgi:cyclophilin family peptidyl-prolyl cis-trans isomerase